MPCLLHLSDPHFGALEPIAASVFLSHAADLAPDITVLSGDLTMRARRDELESARDFVDALPTPRLLIPGNHDVPGFNGPFSRFFAPFHRYRSYFGEDLEPELILDGVHLVSLNSTRPFGLNLDWSEGFLTDHQISGMVSKFKAGLPDHFRVLILHHPLLAPSHHQRNVVSPLPELLAAMGKAKVDLVLCGHFHTSTLATAGTIGGWASVVSQAPTVCSTRIQGEPQGFHKISISNNRLEITPFVFAKDRFLPRQSVHFHRGKDGWGREEQSPANELLTT
ncbi:metallophosphoesterase [Luteolibacter pohnpeiensis]|uniref:Metallophosphoesterase n=1 Tax=Luteolibacter pohnpeiensis TaxID=454153 RepID=A0A934S7X5_9BACT|nr:metallophosphoesterase [Luteolibacter pohnpeiensis]MBK1883483.1 metallophosphoesterase [Luteolibacter pohnpeiensis]